jgi:hypothetical protein
MAACLRALRQMGALAPRFHSSAREVWMATFRGSAYAWVHAGQRANARCLSSSPSTSPPAPVKQQPMLQMTFTCNSCDTRSTKTFTKHSYQRGESACRCVLIDFRSVCLQPQPHCDHGSRLSGIVIVICPGCSGMHLIADNLGWFGNEPRCAFFFFVTGYHIESMALTSLPPRNSQ